MDIKFWAQLVQAVGGPVVLALAMMWLNYKLWCELVRLQKTSNQVLLSNAKVMGRLSRREK